MEAQFSEVMTTNEAMRYLKITRKTLLKLVNTGEIKAAKAGKDFRYLKSEIDKFLRCENTEDYFSRP